MRQTKYGANQVWGKPSMGQTKYGANQVWGKPSMGQTEYELNKDFAEICVRLYHNTNYRN
jgi:hypothetical protein